MFTTCQKTLIMKATSIVLLTIFVCVGATPAPAAAAGCYDTAYSHGTNGLELRDDEYTRWYYGKTTASCSDLNVKIVGAPFIGPCTVYVLGRWYSESQAQWVEGTAGWVKVQARWEIGNETWPDGWATPLTNVADGTRISYIFYQDCWGPAPGRNATLWSAE